MKLPAEIAAKHTPGVIARIERLNPQGIEQGARPRGWHPKRRAWEYALVAMVMSKGEVIRRYGREVWDCIPRDRVLKDGRRQFVAERVAKHIVEQVAAVRAIVRVVLQEVQ